MVPNRGGDEGAGYAMEYPDPTAMVPLKAFWTAEAPFPAYGKLQGVSGMRLRHVYAVELVRRVY